MVIRRGSWLRRERRKRRERRERRERERERKREERGVEASKDRPRRRDGIVLQNRGRVAQTGARRTSWN